MGLEQLRRQLIHHEGMRLAAYLDPVGILTVGVGRNLVANPADRELGRHLRLGDRISESEAMRLLTNDLNRVVRDVQNNIRNYFMLTEPRQHVLLDMAFNLGISGLLRFQNMLAALDRRDYNRAAEEMLNSLWARQVGQRARNLSSMMRHNLPFERVIGGGTPSTGTGTSRPDTGGSTGGGQSSGGTGSDRDAGRDRDRPGMDRDSGRNRDSGGSGDRDRFDRDAGSGSGGDRFDRDR